MTFLYGDATESPLQQDYLSLLSSVVDFGVAVLRGMAEVADLETEASRLEEEAREAHRQLDALDEDFTSVLTLTAERTSASVAQRCLTAIVDQGAAELEQSRREVERELTEGLANTKEAIRRVRRGNLDHVGQLLVREQWPGSVEWVDLVLTASGAYRADLVGHAPIQLAWVIALHIPSTHPFAAPLTVEDVVGPLTIDAPAEAGWVRKSVKRRATKLGRAVVTGYTRTGDAFALELRNAPGEAEGYDFVLDDDGRATAGYLVTEGERGDGFELEGPDRAAVEELGRQLRAVANMLIPHRREVAEVLVDGEPLETHDDPSQLVSRMVSYLAPVVADIAARSPVEGELVLKRAVEGARREEIYVSKADLRARVDALPPPAAALFAPLGIVPEAAPSSG